MKKESDLGKGRRSLLFQRALGMNGKIGIGPGENPLDGHRENVTDINRKERLETS